jgi:hypothetical protein
MNVCPSDYMARYDVNMPTADRVLFVLTLLAALGSGIIAGVFYAFSTFVMKALARLPAEQGAAAMQSINVAVINPMFLGAFLGTALICIGTAIGAFMRWDRPAGHDDLQRAAQQRAGGNLADGSGDGAVLGRLRVALDGVEPRPHGRRAAGDARVHPRAVAMGGRLTVSGSFRYISALTLTPDTRAE